MKTDLANLENQEQEYGEITPIIDPNFHKVFRVIGVYLVVFAVLLWISSL